MTFKAYINIMPQKAILDPQGEAVCNSLNSLDFSINQVRVGKRIELNLNASDVKQAEQLAEKACKKLLVNQIMESYSIEIQKV